ncbi:hypothetical protein Tco_1559203, partial [Tanacetum coccineum]
QEKEISNLKKSVKKLEKKKKSRTYRLRRLYKVGLSARIVSLDDEASLGDQEDVSKQGRKIHDIDVDEDITLDSTHFDTNLDMFGVHDLKGNEVIVEHMDVSAGEKVVVAEQSEKVVEEVVSTAKVSNAVTITIEHITLAKALAPLKSAKPKVDKPTETRTTIKTTTTPITSSKDKGKGIMVEEPLKMKKKDQVLFDEQEAIRLQAQFDEEERIAREKEEANAALIVQWNGDSFV